MVEFKICMADPKGKTFQKEVKDKDADFFIGKNIGDSVRGESFGLTGYEFTITGGSDKCGFPMRRGILGLRKKLNLRGGVGLRKNFSKGIKKRKTVCGHKINENITQINLKITKHGSKKLDEKDAPKDIKKPETKEEEKKTPQAKEDKKPEVKEQTKETKKEAPENKEEKKEAPAEEKSQVKKEVPGQQ